MYILYIISGMERSNYTPKVSRTTTRCAGGLHLCPNLTRCTGGLHLCARILMSGCFAPVFPAIPERRSCRARRTTIVCSHASSDMALTTSQSQIANRRDRPILLLAPMEVLGDAQFRLGMSVIGGFDEAVHEFMRIPHGSKERDIRGILGRRFHVDELAHAGIPLAAQIMCGEPAAAGGAARFLATRSLARRVDLNCGCPSRRANSDKHGGETAAGASLLREPDRLNAVARAMVDAVETEDTVISVKMRSGFDDSALFDDCVTAARDAGISMLTVHGRTRKQGYKGSADWSNVARAVSLCKGSQVIVVGNGDCVEGADVKARAKETGCHGVMIGRGAVSNSHIFWDARRTLGELSLPETSLRCSSRERAFLLAYFAAGANVPVNLPEDEMMYEVRRATSSWGPRQHLKAASRLKMIINYAEWGNGGIREAVRQVQCHGDSIAFLDYVIAQMQIGYADMQIGYAEMSVETTHRIKQLK